MQRSSINSSRYHCSGPLSDSDKGETMIDTVLHGSRRIPIYWKTKRTSSGALAGGDSLWTMPMSCSQSRVGTRDAQDFPCDSVGADDDLVLLDFWTSERV
jgi:hypothetical protein